MKATPLEFRFRFLIITAIYFLGFTAPWNYWLHLDSIRTWQLLASWPARAGWLSFSNATIAVLLFGILCALIAALLRTCGTAYLSPTVVQDSRHARRMPPCCGSLPLSSQPSLPRHLHPHLRARDPHAAHRSDLLHSRNQPLPTSPDRGGRILPHRKTRRTLSTAYCAKVPRLIPALAPQIPASTDQPRWLAGLLGEIYMWGVVATFAIFGWRYNSILLIKGVLISLGISLIIRALLPRR